MGIWMFYGCLTCERPAPAKGIRSRWERDSPFRRLHFRLGQSLRAALLRAGPVGGHLGPGGLLSVAALHLLPGLLSHLLVRLPAAAAALPGDVYFLEQGGRGLFV